MDKSKHLSLPPLGEKIRMVKQCEEYPTIRFDGHELSTAEKEYRSPRKLNFPCNIIFPFGMTLSMIDRVKQRILEKAQHSAPKRLSEWVESIQRDSEFWGFQSRVERYNVAKAACRSLLDEGHFVESAADLTLELVSKNDVTVPNLETSVK